MATSNQQPTRLGSGGASTERIQKLSERLSNLQKTMATEKKSQYERMETRLQIMRNRMQDAGEVTQKKFGVIKE